MYSRSPGFHLMGAVGGLAAVLLFGLLAKSAPEAVARERKPKAGAAVGNVAYDFELPNAANEMVRLSSFRGKVVVLNFWASWCGPCRREVPGLVALQARYPGEVQVIGISLDDWWGPANLYVKDAQINYLVLLADNSIRTQYGQVKSVPVSFIIDRDGVIRAKQKGLASAQFFESSVRKLLGN